jgi:hypothetical protein
MYLDTRRAATTQVTQQPSTTTMKPKPSPIISVGPRSGNSWPSVLCAASSGKLGAIPSPSNTLSPHAGVVDPYLQC